MNSKKKMLLAFGLAGIMTIGAAGAVFAETSDSSVSDKSAYSYNTGKTNHKGLGGERTFIYDESVKADRTSCGRRTGEKGDCTEKLKSITENGIITQEQADSIISYLSENADRHLDTEALVEAGIINEEISDAISEYAAQKHSDIHNRYAPETDETENTPNYRYHEGKAKYAAASDEE